MIQLEKVSRRDFLTGLAAGSLATFSHRIAIAQQSLRTFPAPERSGLDHVVLVMMENRSFDHLLGWLPGANGRQAGLRYPDFLGQLQPTHHLTDFQGCAFQDPDHSYEGARIEWPFGGACPQAVTSAEESEWAALQTLAGSLGFPKP